MHIEDAEWSKTYLFHERNKKFVLKEKLRKISIFYENIGKNVFNGYYCKNVTKHFCIFLHFRTFCIFFSFSEKTTILDKARGQPPFTDWSVTYMFFLRLPLHKQIVYKSAYFLIST